MIFLLFQGQNSYAQQDHHPEAPSMLLPYHSMDLDEELKGLVSRIKENLD